MTSSGRLFSQTRAAQLDQLAGRMNQSWFPVHPLVLSRVQKRLNEGIYDNAREQLIQDLKCDSSLYLLCLRELSRLTSQNFSEGEKRPARSFTNAMKDAAIDEIKSILNRPNHKFSTYSLEGITPAQAERLQEGLLSATTAESLGPKLGIDARVSYNCALLRQLGLTLIAWNYPQAYQQAIDIVKQPEAGTQASLDTVLRSLLGFSPALLGVKIAQSWGLSSVITDVLSASSEEQLSGNITLFNKAEAEQNEKSAVLSQICQVGEALARAAHPRTYPSAASDWAGAKQVILRELGQSGLEVIFSRAQEIAIDYVSFAPQLFQIADDAIIAAGKLSSNYAKERLQKNLYLRGCPKKTREALLSLYNQMDDTLDEALLREFFYQTLPHAGFDCACVFMLDPSVGSLVPTFRSGVPHFLKTKPVKLFEDQSIVNPLRQAFSQSRPLEELGIIGGQQKKFLLGSVGEQRSIGVFYLETSETTCEHSTTIFQAARQCFHDLLHLS